MADNSKTFQELLIEQRTTNEKLSALNSDNKTIGQLLKELNKPATSEENIAGALPEILSDVRNTKKQISNDKRLRDQEIKAGVFEVDDILVNLNDSILLGFDTLVEIFEDQVSIAKSALIYEKQRDIRQKREELSKPSDGDIIADKLDEIEKNKDLEEIGKGGTSFFGGLSGALAGVSLGGLIKGIGKSLLKGGFYGLIGAVIGDELVHQFDIENESLRDALKSGLPLSLLGFGIAGVPGALLGLVGSGLLDLHDYLAGETESLSGYTWASLTFGTGGLLAWTQRAKLKKYLKEFGVVGSLARAIQFTPFLIGAGAAIALGGAALFIAGQMEKYEQQALDRAKKLIDEEGFGDIIEESETLRTPRPGIGSPGSEETRNLKKISESFLEKFEKDELLPEDVQDAQKLIEQIINLPEEQLGEILKDKGKRDDIFEVVNNLTALAGQQVFDDAEMVKRILKLQDIITQGIPYRDDIIDAAGQTYLERVELNAEIERMKKELDEKMDEYGIRSIQKSRRGPVSEEMKELIGYENEIKELQKELQVIDEQLNTQRIGTEGATTSFADIAEALGGEEEMLKYLESRNIVPLSDAMSESINQNSELLRELTELLDQNKTSVSQNIFSGGTRTNLYQKNNDVVLNKSNKSNDTTFNAVSSSNF